MTLSNGEDMSKGRSSISKASSYEEIAEFWDTHDFSDYWDQSEPVEFEIDIQGEEIYYAVDRELSAKIQYIAKKHGISADTLINLWLQEELQEDQTKPVESEFITILNKKYYAIDVELSDKIHAIAKQWDVSANDLANLWLMRKVQRDQVEITPFESGIKFPKRYYAVDRMLSDKIKTLANQRGISEVTLVNLYLQIELQRNQKTSTPLPKEPYAFNKDLQLVEAINARAKEEDISPEKYLEKLKKMLQPKKQQEQEKVKVLT
jgi:hypothetical protein